MLKDFSVNDLYMCLANRTSQAAYDVNIWSYCAHTNKKDYCTLSTSYGSRIEEKTKKRWINATKKD